MDHDDPSAYELDQSHNYDHEAKQDMDELNNAQSQPHAESSLASSNYDQQNLNGQSQPYAEYSLAPSNYDQQNPNGQSQPQDQPMPVAQQPAPLPQPAQYPPPQGDPGLGDNQAGGPGGAGGPQVSFMFQSNNAGPNQPASYFQPQGPQPQAAGQSPVQFPNQHYYQTNTNYQNGAHQTWSANPPSPAIYVMGPQSGFQQGAASPVNFPPTNNGHAQFGVNSGCVGPTLVHGNGAAPVIPVQYTRPQVGLMMMQQPVPSEGWQTGLFECMDDPDNAVVTAFCPCITFGQVAEILDNGHTSCTTSGLLYGLVAFLIGIPCIMSCSYRTKLRSKFNLIETPAPDWVTHFLCEWCALCQEYRELQRRGVDPSIGWQGNVERAQAGFIQQQANMVPPMNQRMMP